MQATDGELGEIEDSPDQPVSQQFEEPYHRHDGWPVYWGGRFMWGGY